MVELYMSSAKFKNVKVQDKSWTKIRLDMGEVEVALPKVSPGVKADSARTQRVTFTSAASELQQMGSSCVNRSQT